MIYNFPTFPSPLAALPDALRSTNTVDVITLSVLPPAGLFQGPVRYCCYGAVSAETGLVLWSTSAPQEACVRVFVCVCVCVCVRERDGERDAGSSATEKKFCQVTNKLTMAPRGPTCSGCRHVVW